MKKVLYYVGSVIQNIVLVGAFIVAGLEAAKKGFSEDRKDYRNYELLESRKVFRD